MENLKEFVKFLNSIPGLLDLAILVVLLGTAIAIILQLRAQKKIFKVQLLKDRITMAWSTDEPITEEHINHVKYLPDDFIPEKYKNSNDDIGKYLYLEQVYDYFLYVFTSAEIMNDDPLGPAWRKEWIKILVGNDMFNEIRAFNENSFDEFDKFLEGIKESINT